MQESPAVSSTGGHAMTGDGISDERLTPFVGSVQAERVDRPSLSTL